MEPNSKEALPTEMRWEHPTHGTVMRACTWWWNPLEHDVVLTLNLGWPRGEGPPYGRPPANDYEKTGRVIFRIPAQGQAAIPSEFDTAIQQVRDGQIVGGLAPQLSRMSGSEPAPQLHPAMRGHTLVQPLPVGPESAEASAVDQQLLRLSGKRAAR